MKEGLFVLPFQRFVGIVSLVFSKFWHGARNPSEVERGSAVFFKKKKKKKKKKRGKIDQKWTEDRVFLKSMKICVIYFY